MKQWNTPEKVYFMRGPRIFFSEGVQLFLSWFGERGSNYHYKRAIIGSPAKRFVIFEGLRTSIAKKPYIFLWIFRGGPDPLPPPPPSGSAHVSWCREEGKDQRSIQSRSSPDFEHHMGQWQKHKKTQHTREPRGQPNTSRWSEGCKEQTQQHNKDKHEP